MAVAWGLEQLRYYTQGCDGLAVVTDHKPLVCLLRCVDVMQMWLSRLGFSLCDYKRFLRGISAISLT